MNKLLVLLASLLLCGAATAQQPATVVDPATMEVAMPQYVYCEIIANDMPSYSGDGVLFDFGQSTNAWAYNWLHDGDGNKLIFESGVGALNYMVFRGWEFVQAYTSGKEVQNLHYLLRIAASKLSSEQQQQLLSQPRKKGEKKK